MIVITGATGKLGRCVVEALLAKVPADRVAVAVRSPDKAADLAARGVEVRFADYQQPATIESALRGAEQVLLVSSNEISQRVPQHRAVIEAARRAGASLLVYTSRLRADSPWLSFARDHRETERAIRASGIPYVFLRNNRYMENYSENLEMALQDGVIFGSAGEGLISAATRADLAAAAVAALTERRHENRTYELAGDGSFSMRQLAAEVTRQSRQTVVYHDLPPEQYRGLLLNSGWPLPRAELRVNSDVGISRGDMNDTSGDLRCLIGHPTTPLADAIARVLPALRPLSLLPPY